MKKRVLALVAVLFLFGAGYAVYACLANEAFTREADANAPKLSSI